MKPIRLADLKDIAEYETVRERMRADVIELKKRRRVSVGDNLTLLFENRETVLFQVQEMMRTERIVHEDKVQEEIDAYDALLPGKDEVSATLFIEILDLYKLEAEEVRRAVNRFQGLDEGCVFLVLGRVRERAHFEGGHSKEEKVAAVHYVRFRVPREGRQALADPAADVRLVVDHPNYQAEAVLSPATRQELLADLAP
jgi:hypothetical protein